VTKLSDYLRIVYGQPDGSVISHRIKMTPHEDLYLFRNLKPGETDRRGMALHRTFVAKRFVLQDAEGLIPQPDNPPKVTAAIPDEGVSLAELTAHKLTFEM
jgi:hypothetical protein